MGKCLPKLRFNPSQIQQVKNIINGTGLWLTSSRTNLDLEMEIKAERVLNTADYLGQMSDPEYLRKLPMLYVEFIEGGVFGYASVEDLLEKTPEFFQDFVMKRLREDFHSVYRFAANHFRGRNLYIEGIKWNLTQIKIPKPCVT